MYVFISHSRSTVGRWCAGQESDKTIVYGPRKKTFYCKIHHNFIDKIQNLYAICVRIMSNNIVHVGIRIKSLFKKNISAVRKAIITDYKEINFLYKITEGPFRLVFTVSVFLMAPAPWYLFEFQECEV